MRRMMICLWRPGFMVRHVDTDPKLSPTAYEELRWVLTETCRSHPEYAKAPCAFKSVRVEAKRDDGSVRIVVFRCDRGAPPKASELSTWMWRMAEIAGGYQSFRIVCNETDKVVSAGELWMAKRRAA